MPWRPAELGLFHTRYVEAATGVKTREEYVSADTSYFQEGSEAGTKTDSKALPLQ